MSTSTTNLGPDDAASPKGTHAVVPEEIDREINVRRILWCGFWLTVVTLVSQLLMWWFLRGFQVWDQHHEARMLPMAVANPQQPPPTPRLQVDPTADMVGMRADEDQALTRAGWVDHEGGTLRVSIDVAMDAIAKRGVAPFPATGAAPAATPAPGLAAPVKQTTPTGSPATAVPPTSPTSAPGANQGTAAIAPKAKPPAKPPVR
jgi:hypothetical protein